MTKYFLLLLFFTFTGCREECYVEKNCIAEILEENNMIGYANQDLGCKLYLSLFEYKGEQYFLLNNNCVDMISYPFNCHGEQLCENLPSEACISFYEEALLSALLG